MDFSGNLQVPAKLTGAPLSAQKARLIVDMVRNMSVDKAINVLGFTQKKGAKIVKKLLESAIANAEHNHGADVDELKISAAYVNEGPTLKRIRARAKGRANRILKRTCHITLIVSDEE